MAHQSYFKVIAYLNLVGFQYCLMYDLKKNYNYLYIFNLSIESFHVNTFQILFFSLSLTT
jgi:hypothetical protein